MGPDFWQPEFWRALATNMAKLKFNFFGAKNTFTFDTSGSSTTLNAAFIRVVLPHSSQNDQLTKTGSGQTQGSAE
jgi:hypothetical protein